MHQGWYEERYIRFLERYVFPCIDPHSIALDIGANIGNHSNRFANYFSQVHAFEPNQRVFYLLEANAMLTPLPHNAPQQKIVTHNVGCSDRQFSQPVKYSVSNVGAASLEIDSANDTQRAVFQLVRLDDYLPFELHSKVGFIKLDVEQHETQALKGAEQIIISSRPIIVFEAHNFDGPSEYLKSLDYQYFYGFEKIKAGYRKSTTNLVAVNNENKNKVHVDMVIASPLKADSLIGAQLER